MKKMVAFCVLLLMLSLTVVQANSIQSIDMKIDIDANGNAKVTEVWNCNTSQGTESYHPYYNLGTSKIQNLIVTDESGRQYETLSSWNVNKSFNEKKYTCGIHSISNGVELCWGISEYGKKEYTVNYEITNFVSQLNDAQMVYWTLIPYDFSTAIGNVEIEMKADEPFADTLDVWGYGNYGGLCYVSDGTIKMNSDGKLDTSEYMTILVKFPQGLFQCQNKIEKDFSYYLNMAEEGATHYQKTTQKSNRNFFVNLVQILAPVTTMFFFILTVIGIIGSSLQIENVVLNKEQKRQIKQTEYYRGIPCEKNVLKAFFVAYVTGLTKGKSDIMGALLLKWLKEKRLTIEKRQITKGTILKREKEETCVVFYKATYDDLDIKEKELYEMMYEASEDGVLERDELKKWSSNKYSRLFDWFEHTVEGEKRKLIASLELEERTEGKVFPSKKYYPSEKMITEAVQLSGLKKYLKDYTLIHEREPIEITMFEDYLIYAQIFGIADKVMKDFEKLYPDLIEQTEFYSYNNIYFLTNYARTSYTSASSAKAAAESYSSGGGGFSSGGGGGGSFGGGGGRRRIPLKLNRN